MTKIETITLETSENAELKAALSRALRAICFTRDYVGGETLPAIEGWEWYEAGVEISALIPDDRWAREFEMRIAPCQICNAPNGRCFHLRATNLPNNETSN
jgi:hypothetical protein